MPWHIRSLWPLATLVVLLGLSFAAVAQEDRDHPDAASQPSTIAAKTGAFVINFTQRSPLSDFDQLAVRLNVPKDQLGPDYDVRGEGFAVYVPTNYEASAPVGILFYEVNHGTPEITQDLQALMDKHHLIMIATQGAHLPLGLSAGLCLDAVFNVEKQYAIDPTRIYFIGGGDGVEQIGWCTDDIFAGDTYLWWFGWFRKFGNYLPNTKLIPSEKMLRLARTRPQVLTSKEDPSEDAFRKAVVRTMVGDGFEHVFTNQDVGISAEWFDQVLKMMESVRFAPPTTGEVAATQPTTMPAKTGDFEITFNQRSPLSDYSKLVERLGTTKDVAGPDYDLNEQPFAVYVPAAYDGSAPYGLLVQNFQDGSNGIAEPTFPLLDAHHLIAIATERDHLPLATNLGLCLDAVYNMQQRYHIDPSRIYLMGLSKPIMPIGMCSGDIFTGDVYIWWFDFYGTIPGMIMPDPTKYKPTARSVMLAKTHMQVLEFNPDQKVEARIPGALRQDGFDHVFGATMDKKDFLDPPWFAQVLEKLDSVHASPVRLSTGTPATQPSPDQPQRLLSLAQSYIASGRPDLARAKLNQIIEKYPDSDAAQKAKELLDQISSQ
jgi:hypothetical protein